MNKVCLGQLVRPWPEDPEVLVSIPTGGSFWRNFFALPCVKICQVIRQSRNEQVKEQNWRVREWKPFYGCYSSLTKRKHNQLMGGVNEWHISRIDHGITWELVFANIRHQLKEFIHKLAYEFRLYLVEFVQFYFYNTSYFSVIGWKIFQKIQDPKVFNIISLNTCAWETQLCATKHVQQPPLFSFIGCKRNDIDHNVDSKGL